jgi:hypothetical protein
MIPVKTHQFFLLASYSCLLLSLKSRCIWFRNQFYHVSLLIGKPLLCNRFCVPRGQEEHLNSLCNPTPILEPGNGEMVSKYSLNYFLTSRF